MDILEATKNYERWLAGHTRLIAADLRRKHACMADPASAFPFLRATFYRWMQLWPALCPKLTDAPRMLAVGDLHLENFGTWRDAEGRLAWGINDFDEAYELPYVQDLVRLAASAILAIDAQHLALSARAACDAILKGYEHGIRQGGRPFVFAEEHAGLRRIIDRHRGDPAMFWKKISEGIKQARSKAPTAAIRLLRKALPVGGRDFRCGPRIAGMGSLGRQRFVGVADWQGGLVAREVKALTPSACRWALGEKGAGPLRYLEIVRAAIRCPDPFLSINAGWVIRRLAPDSRKIEMTTAGGVGDEYRFLRAMGRETANVHLGSRRAIAAIRRDLTRRKRNWLWSAAKDMVEAMIEDWRKWRGAFHGA